MPTKKIVLKIDGMTFQDSDMDDLIDLTVDSDYFLPTMFAFTLNDSFTVYPSSSTSSGTLKYTDGGRFKVGAQIEITISAQPYDESSAQQHVLTKGEITSIEPIFAPGGQAMLRVRGYDRAHRLTYGKQIQAFNEISEADLVNKICQANGLSASVNSSGISSLRYEYFIQYNQTNWELLWEHARMLGYQVYVDDHTLHFEPANTLRNSGEIALEWGADLTSFEPRLSVMGQVTEVTSSGWDPIKKEGVTSTANSSSTSLAPTIGAASKGGAALKTAFGVSKDYQTGHTIRSAAEAKAFSQGSMTLDESGYIRADGYCKEGDPRILAGTKVKISGVGSTYSGSYIITQASHQWQAGGYTVNFSMAGNTPNTVLSLLQADSGIENNKIFGTVVGLITNVKDPQKLGRVKVKYPWIPKIGGAEIESSWAWFATPSSGKDHGIYFGPDVGDEVLVCFEHGDPNYPYVVGMLWNGKDKPPAGTAEIYASDGKVNQNIIRSRSGHLIILDDSPGKEQVIIQDKSGKTSIIIDSAKKSMTLKTEGDFIIESGGKFTVNSRNAVSIDSKAGSEITCTGAFKVDSKQEATLKVMANTVSVKSAGSEVTGMKVDIKSNTMASISGTAMVEIKGALVKIN